MRCSMTPSTVGCVSGTGVRRGRPPRARRCAVRLHRHLPSQVWGCETALQGARLRLSREYLAAGGDARRARGAAHPTFAPGRREMLTISRPGRLAGAPRPACWAARLGASALFSPIAGCPVTMLHVCTPVSRSSKSSRRCDLYYLLTYFTRVCVGGGSGELFGISTVVPSKGRYKVHTVCK